MGTSIDPIKLQVDSFLKLVNAVNEIPRVVINLNGEDDPQRDALAFIVNSVFLQFKEFQPELGLQKLIEKVRSWNTPPASMLATASLLKLINHLFEYRVLELLKSDLPETEKENAQALHLLYNVAVNSLLQNANPDNPIYIGGIPRVFLPEWYVNQYIKCS